VNDQQPREHFIPLRKSELEGLLASRLEGGDDRRRFGELCRMLEATFHFEYHERLERLKDAYSAFDPDADTRRLTSCDAADLNAQLDTLFGEFLDLLERANFRRLTQDDVDAALASASDWGMNLSVDFECFERLEIFARGDVTQQRERRRPLNFYRREMVDVPTYQRLVVIFRLNEQSDKAAGDQRPVYLKIFKNIPHADLDMLLPGTTVKMTLLDRAKILLPTLSGIVITATKILKGALVLAFAGVYGLLAFIGLVGGTVGYGVKSFFGYLRTKEKYQLSLTQSLYFQNLDNNAGVLFRLLDEAEEQECREAMLAYFILWQHAGEEGWTEERLDDEAEMLLREAIGLDVDFEVDDALAKLRRLGIIETTAQGRLRAVPIKEALARLDAAWDNFFDYHNTPSIVPAPQFRDSTKTDAA
jgi:hypothetical protein